MDIKFKLTYSYISQIFFLIILILIFVSGIQSNPVLVIIFTIIGTTIIIFDLKDIAQVELNEISFVVIYHPFYKGKRFEYNLKKIENVSIYFSYKKGHSTILFIKQIDSECTIKHNMAMSVGKSKKLAEVFRSLNVNVTELEWPKVAGKVVTLP